MTQKIYRTLQNISRRSCSIWGALAAALLVHLLLALLFKHNPGENHKNVSELPRVGHIVLSSPSNAELTKWMKNHDPAVMTAADTQLGYSQIMNQKYLRSEPEDLPNLLQPVMPQKITGINQVSTLKTSGKVTLSGNIHFIQKSRQKAPEAETAVLNGEYSAALGRLFAAMIAENHPQLPPDVNKLPDTVLEIVPGRLAETGSRVIVAQSCGNRELDRKAMETLYKYMLKGAADNGYCGKALFLWRNVKVPEEQKI